MPFRRRHARLCIAVALWCQPLVLTAQSSPPPAAQTGEPIRWWHGAVVLAGISGLMLLDQPFKDFAQDNRSSGSNDVARTFKHIGQPEVYGTVTLGLLGAGLIGHNPELARVGGRLAASLALAGVTTTGLKQALGRPRPNESVDADVFSPFSGNDAMPSGHTTVAFALATSLADDINRTWATIGLYTVATGVGWSRVNDNRHWLSDVGLGAVIGVTSAKLVNGRWRIFHLHPPAILLDPQRAGLVWQASF